MNFMRTMSGMSNMHLFCGVDAIVFVEGGSSMSVESVQSGAFEGESQDIGFWQKWFHELLPNLKVQFRAVGAKPTLRSIAQGVADGTITDVYVAMDRDFDNLCGIKIESPRVLYTLGYSWENDVWNESVIEEVFYTLCAVCRSTTTKLLRGIIVSSFAGFERDTHWATKGDLLCVQHCIPLLPRDKPQRVIIQASHGNPPKINKAAILRLLRDAKKRKVGAIKNAVKVRLEARTDCCGHLVGSFSYSLLMYLFKRFCKRGSYSVEVVASVAIDKMFEKIRLGAFEDLRLHYYHQITA